MLSMFRDDSTRKQTQNRKPFAMRPTPKGCGFYGLVDKYGEVLQKGAIVTAELDRLRFRPPDPES